MTNENFNEIESFVDSLADVLGKLPQPKLKILDPRRYELMLETANRLSHLLREASCEGMLDIEINEMFNCGSITLETDSFTIYSTKRLADLVCDADNVDIYPLTNGKLRIDITFQNVLRSVF